MATQDAVINFRVTPQERRQLRVMLLEEGRTVQAFFDQVVKEKLCERQVQSATGGVGQLVPQTVG